MPGQEQDHRATGDDRLRAALHREAARHTPDREYILRRLEQTRPGGRHHAETGTDCLRSPARRPLRLSGAAALGTLLLVGGATAWAVAAFQPDDRPSIRISDGPLAPPAATSPTATDSSGSPASPVTGTPADDPSPTATATAASTTGSPSAPSATTPAAGTGTQTGGAGVAPPERVTGSTGAARQDHFLWAQGAVDSHSTDTWAQSNVTVRTQVALRTLQVEVRITRTPGVEHTGAWTSLAPADLTEEIVDSGSEVVYRFTLRQGVVLQPGQYVFAAQYHHAQGARDAGQDRYTAAASGQDGSAGSAAVDGRFS